MSIKNIIKHSFENNETEFRKTLNSKTKYDSNTNGLVVTCNTSSCAKNEQV